MKGISPSSLSRFSGMRMVAGAASAGAAERFLMQNRSSQRHAILRDPARLLFLVLAVAPLGRAQSAPAPLPSAPPVTAAPDSNPFPPVDPQDFTADTPTKDTINSFLKATWGFDPNRIWQIQAISKTPADGVSRVVVLVTDKGAPKDQVQQLVFYSLPDGKHVVANGVLPFGPNPFAANRQLLQDKADGPFQGSSSKSFEMVEFSDFECPHCKDAQGTVAKLIADYPNARFVSQNFPLVRIHSEAFKAAAYGVCVAQLSGNAVFFKFADAVFAAQDSLTPQTSDDTLKAAVMKAGGDPAKVSACSMTDATKASVQASLDLGNQVGVTGTPTLFVNGRGLPLEGIPYDTLRQIIDYQASSDGILIPPHAAAAPPNAPASPQAAPPSK